MADRIAVDYRNTTVYYETALNAVGATDSVTLRTGLAVPGVYDAYCKRFGTPYPVLDVLADILRAQNLSLSRAPHRLRQRAIPV